MSPKKRADKSQQLSMSFDSTEATSANGTDRNTASEPNPPATSKGSAKRQPELFAGLLDDNADDADALASDDTLDESLALVPVEGTPLGFLETETVNALVAMAGLSAHTQRAYRRWIGSYLADINKIDRRTIDLKALNVQLAVNSLGAGNLKAWLGHLKARKLGKQSIMQAKAAVVWLAQLMGDVGRSDYSVASGLSRVKAPRAETGQREGTWLTQDEVRQLIRALRKLDASGGAGVSRNTAIIVLMVTCGLRRDEIATTTWGDLGRQGGNAILRVHGKGEKLRTVKLPDMVLQAIERWKPHHPNPAPDRPIFTRIYKGGRVSSDAITDKAIWLFVIKAAQAAGLPRITPHDLRRSFARGAYEAGVSFELIRQSLGHSNIATTERYVNSVLELDRAATDIWAGTLSDEEDEA